MSALFLINTIFFSLAKIYSFELKLLTFVRLDMKDIAFKTPFLSISGMTEPSFFCTPFNEFQNTTATILITVRWHDNEAAKLYARVINGCSHKSSS